MKKRVVLLSLILFLLSSVHAGWSGTYSWVNPGVNDNSGKMRELVFRIEDREGQVEAYLLSDGAEYRVLPLVELTEEGDSWHRWNGKDYVSSNFRILTGKFNRTSFSPTKWKVEEIVTKGDGGCTVIAVGAFFITIRVRVDFLLSLDENGNKQLTFTMDADWEPAKAMFFSNPEKNSGGAFVLRPI